MVAMWKHLGLCPLAGLCASGRLDLQVCPVACMVASCGQAFSYNIPRSLLHNNYCEDGGEGAVHKLHEL